jgi:glycosyltransferase involved in cell wall biosynthesis
MIANVTPDDRRRAATRSMRRLRILAVGDERVASTRYRVLSHVELLKTAGFDVDVRLEGDQLTSALARWYGHLRSLLFDTPGRSSDEIFLLHRRTYPPPFHRLLKHRKSPFVFDMDDALDLPPPSREQTRALVRRYRRNFVATTSLADLVICGNSFLTSRVPHDRTTIIPTSVDCKRFTPDAIRRDEDSVIGWVGHSDNLVYLEALCGVFREITTRHPRTRLLVVADRPPHLPGVRTEFRKWRLEDEVSCFDSMNIGLMPLEDTPWSRAKCSFKLLQYMALGIPAVASPVGMNSEVVAHGHNGFLAQNPDDWFFYLDRLLSDAALSRRLAEEGRRVVLARYSSDVVGPLLVDALTSLSNR